MCPPVACADWTRAHLPGKMIGHPRTPAHPRRVWRTGSRVASGRLARVDASPLGSCSGLGQPSGSEAKRRETCTEQKPTPGAGGHSPPRPRADSVQPHQPRPACPHHPPHLPKTAAGRVLSFRSRYVFRFLFTVIAGAAVGTAQGDEGLVCWFCGLTRSLTGGLQVLLLLPLPAPARARPSSRSLFSSPPCAGFRCVRRECSERDTLSRSPEKTRIRPWRRLLAID